MPASVEGSYRDALADRRLALLLGGDALSKVGDGMLIVALPLQTLRTAGPLSPAIAISLIESAPYALAVAVSLVFGLGRRRFQPRRLLITDCAVRLTVFSGLGALAVARSLPLWLLGGALLGGSGLRLLAASSRRLVVTSMSPDEHRFAVNGLLGTSDSLAAYVVGPALGGVLASAFSPGLVLLLDGVSFLVLLLVVLLVIPLSRNDTPQLRSPQDTGWSVLKQVPVAALLLGVVFLFNLLYMPVEVGLPLLVRHVLHGSSSDLGGIWTIFGVGALLGSIATNRLRRFPPRLVLVLIIAAWAASMVVLAAAHSVVVAGVAMGIGGVVYAPFTPVVYTLVQKALARDQQQPVLTLWAAGTAIAAPVGLLLGGPLVQLTGTRGGLLTSALLTLILAPTAALVLRRRQPQSKLPETP